MARFKRMISALLAAAILFLIVPQSVSSAEANGIHVSDDLKQYEVVCYSNIVPTDKLAVYLYEGRFYAEIEKIADLARFSSKLNDDADAWQLWQGYRNIYISDDGEMADLGRDMGSVPLIIKDGKWLVEAIPMLKYLGADVKQEGDSSISVMAPLVTIWDVLYDLSHVREADMDISAVYEDGHKAIIRKAFCDMALDLLDNANGEGLSGVFGGHIKSALCDALDVEYEQYGNYKAEDKKIMDALNGSKLIENAAFAALENGPMYADDITTLVQLNYATFERFEFDALAELRHELAPNSPYKSLKDIAYDQSGKLSNEFFKKQSKVDNVSDAILYIDLITDIIVESHSKARFDADATKMLRTVVNDDFIDNYRNNNGKWLFSWPNMAASLGEELSSVPMTVAYETIDASTKLIVQQAIEQGCKSMLEAFATGQGGYIMLLVKFGWFNMSMVFEPFFKAISDDLDAIYLSAVSYDTIMYGYDYMKAHNYAYMDHNELEYMRDLCSLAWRAGLSFAQNFLSSLSVSLDGKARALADKYDDKEGDSVANLMAGRLYRATNCVVNPIEAYSSFTDDILPDMELNAVVTADAAASPSVVSDGHTTFAIKADNSLWAWGGNEYGQLGDGTTENRTKPVKVLDDVRSVEYSGYNTFAIKNDGSLWAWGDNEYGQLGDGTTEDRTKPVKVLDDVKSVENNWDNTFAIKNDGSLWAWGDNKYGQLGDGTTEDRTKPVKVLDDVRSVEYSGYNTFAIKNDGSLWAWGDNEYGQLGDGTTENRNKPVKVMDDVRSVITGNGRIFTIKADGSLWVWGNDTYDYNWPYDLMLTPVSILDDVVAIETYYDGYVDYAFALKGNGDLMYWGFSYYLFPNHYAKSCEQPTLIERNVVAFFAEENMGDDQSNYGYAIAIKNDGSVVFWGHEYDPDNKIKTISGIPAASQIYTDFGRIYVLDENGNLYACRDSDPQFDKNGYLVEYEIKPPYKVSKNVLYLQCLCEWVDYYYEGMDSANFFNYMIKEDGSLWGWGRNESGLLGTNTEVDILSPVKILDNIRIP